MQRRLIARLLLAFALVFTQLGGTAHAISHIRADPDTKHYPADSDKNCAVCQAFSAAAAAAPPTVPPAFLLDAGHVLVQRGLWSAITLDSHWFFARGPPATP